MKNNLSALLVGFIFALGLGLAGMTRPEKIIQFLDVTGNWDPSLLFVMASAVSIHFVTYRLIRRLKSPVFSKSWLVPEKSSITPQLVFGSIIFGIGWGLAGYCPGPAATLLISLRTQPFLFFGMMLAGMYLLSFGGAVRRNLSPKKSSHQ